MSTSPPKTPPPDEGDSSGWYRLAGMGLEFATAIGVCGVGGWMLDRYFLTSPWLLVTGILLGVATGSWMLIKESMRSFKQ